MDIADVVARAARDALTFWLPVDCAGCGAPDESLCDGCRVALVPRPSTREIAPGVAVTCGVVFESAAARVLRALKEEGRTSLARELAPALDAAFALAVAEGARVTTVPSSRAAFRRRGFRPVDLLVRATGRRPHRLLRLRRATADQRGLGRGQRRRNIDGALHARPVHGATVVVVDDVVTTGSTLAEAVRALRAAGAARVIAVAVAGTPRRGPAGEPEVIGA